MITHRTIRASDLQSVNQRLESECAESIIRWAHDLFGSRLAVLSSFQQAGCALCHLVKKLGLTIDVVFVDTEVLFPESYELVRKYEEAGLNVVTLHPERSMEDQTRDEGVLYLTKAGQERCCDLRKKKPLLQAKGRYDAFLSSLHKSAGGARAAVPVLVPDAEMNLLRIHPFANWTKDQLTEYIEEEGVLINPLHSQGYPTIGCTRCTTPVLPGEPERAGRWRHLADLESAYCRINPTDRGGEERIDLPREFADRLLS